MCRYLGLVLVLSFGLQGLLVSTTGAAINQADGILRNVSQVNMTFIVQTSDLQKLDNRMVDNTAKILNKINWLYDHNQLLIKKNKSVCEGNTFFYAEKAEECGSCYRFDLVLRTWDEARSYCRNQGGDLVSIETAGEDQFLTNITKKNQAKFTAHLRRNMYFGFWTSGSDKDQEGTWVWKATGSALNYTKWTGTEPNNYAGNQHFLTFWATSGIKHGSWIDDDPSRNQFSICETILMC